MRGVERLSRVPEARRLRDVRRARSDGRRPRKLAPPRAAGRSFVTTGPLLLLDVDGRKPGDRIALSGLGTAQGAGPRAGPLAGRASRDRANRGQWPRRCRARHAARQAQREWYTLVADIDLKASSWIAARAFGKAKTGASDAESHTNPVYLDVDGKASYDRASLDRLVGKIDEQMAKNRARTFAEKAKLLDYFQKSRDILLKVRARRRAPRLGRPDGVARRGGRGIRPHKEEPTATSN